MDTFRKSKGNYGDISVLKTANEIDLGKKAKLGCHTGQFFNYPGREKVHLSQTNIKPNPGHKTKLMR